MNLTTSAWNHYNDAVRRGIEVSAQGIRDLILNKNKPIYTLMDSFTYYIDNLEKRVGYDVAPNTIKKFRTVESKLKLFLSKKQNRADINLLEITHKFITDFDMFMKIEGGSYSHKYILGISIKYSPPPIFRVLTLLSLLKIESSFMCNGEVSIDCCQYISPQ